MSYQTEPAWERHLQDVTLKEGQTCTMTCQFSVPNVKSEWFRNGRILKPQGRHKTEVEHKVHKLTIADVRAEDQGQYTCKHGDLETSAELRIEGGWNCGCSWCIVQWPKVCRTLTAPPSGISQSAGVSSVPTHTLKAFTHISKCIQNQKGEICVSSNSFA